MWCISFSLLSWVCLYRALALSWKILVSVTDFAMMLLPGIVNDEDHRYFGREFSQDFGFKVPINTINRSNRELCDVMKFEIGACSIQTTVLLSSGKIIEIYQWPRLTERKFSTKAHCLRNSLLKLCSWYEATKNRSFQFWHYVMLLSQSVSKVSQNLLFLAFPFSKANFLPWTA